MDLLRLRRFLCRLLRRRQLALKLGDLLFQIGDLLFQIAVLLRERLHHLVALEHVATCFPSMPRRRFAGPTAVVFRLRRVARAFALVKVFAMAFALAGLALALALEAVPFRNFLSGLVAGLALALEVAVSFRNFLSGLALAIPLHGVSGFKSLACTTA